MTRIGIIGAGNIGETVARLALAAGYEVVLSNSRGPGSLASLIANLGPRAAAGTPADAATADVVVLAIPLGAIPSLPADLLAGRIVVDAGNHYPDRDGAIVALSAPGATTSGLVSDHFLGARVVKGLNSIVWAHLRDLARAPGSPERSALPLATDDAAAGAEVVRFLDDLGYDAFVYGTLADSWRTERDRPAYCLPYAADPEVMRSRQAGEAVPPGAPASTERVRAAVAAAVRDDAVTPADRS
ncbi:NADPH-dependent F420 reductase [Microbacterium gorillae]|uniref:NADPH-dependent F420 reductase n=1 Tax=Microbacterium gorillae TaxID=1231063 RepID=UPI00058FCDE2|nr:NAD(P)-binding domain-containing protein [Microbacterium gorillae]